MNAINVPQALDVFIRESRHEKGEACNPASMKSERSRVMRATEI